MLESIKSPDDIKGMSYKELYSLADEIRNKIIETVGKNGGHLASNLGIVETTIALHRIFDMSRDALIFDVGHQCYTHKLITGRAYRFDSLRKSGGISGFTNREESAFDTFTEGHSGASLSQALGLSAAFEKSGNDRYVVAVIGDGSFTNGMIYEALNNCRTIGKHLIIILNDNEMSISKNVGGFSNHLTKIRTSKKYFTIKHKINRHLLKIPFVGAALNTFAKKSRDIVRRILVSDNIFECMGLDYIGPVDGNDIAKMEIILEEARTKNVCTVVHIHTTKGKGYAPAENNPEKFHSVSAFSKKTAAGCGEKTDESSNERCSETFSFVFGRTMEELTEKNPKICAVTAAMGDGTGLGKYAAKYPSNFYDVGIAEEHAVTFAAGLSRGGALPVTVMYSTFSQRVYDQLHHDAAIQKLPLVLCLDRAGLVEGDGITHQGIFDVSEFSGIPGVNIFSPETFLELSDILTESINCDRLSIIRYPKGSEVHYDRSKFKDLGTCSVMNLPSQTGPKITVITYGRVTANAVEACLSVHKRTKADITLVKLKKIFPIDFTSFADYIKLSDFVYILEEGIKTGGIGEKTAALISENGFSTGIKIHAVEDFVPHGTLDELFQSYGFTAETVENEICEFTETFSSDTLPSEVKNV